MSTLAEFMILSGVDNRPLMLEKHLYDSWKIRMELYMQNREHGRMILELVEHGPLIWPTIEENGMTSTKKYEELSATKKIQADCDLKATNIILQGLPTNVYSLLDCGLAGPVFKQEDDPIDAINKMMSFLSTIVSSRFPTTNNQLSNSSNPRQQETIHDGRCPKPKRKSDATWFRDKVLLVDAQGSGKVLNEEELEFLADPRVAEGPVTQTVIKNNATYQADDLGAYDSDCDDFSTAKAVLMANLSSYGSDVLSEYLLETQNAAVQDTNSSAQQDAMILSVFEQLSNQKAQKIRPMIYDGSVIAKETNVISIADSEETLMLEEENFGKCFVPQQELSDEQAFQLQTSHPTIDQSATSPVKIEAPRELPKASLVNTSLKKFKYHLGQFDNVVKKQITPDALIEREWVFEHTKAIFLKEIIPFVKTLKDIFNVFDKDLLNEVTEVQIVFNQMEGAVQQYQADKYASYSTCKYVKLIQELLGYVRDTCPDIHKPSGKLVTITPINKKIVSFTEPVRSSSTSQTKTKHTTNNSESTSTGVSRSTKSSRLKSTDNTKNGSNSKPKYLDSECSKHMTRDRSQLTNFVHKFPGTVKFGNDQIAKIMGYGDYQIGNITISWVYYVEGLGHNLFPVGQFCDSDLEIQDYALWEVIENGNSWVPIPVTTLESGPSTTLKMTVPSTAKEKICKKNDIKARSLLLMALPNEHQLTFDQYVDAQSMFKVKRSDGANNDDKNLAFLTASSASSINNINTVNPEVSTGTTKVNTASTEISTASFSDATVYAFLSTQPQESQLVHEDLEQLHDDDLEEMDLKWNMALLSMRARKFYQRTGRKIINDGSNTVGYDKSKVECFNCHKMGHFARECRAPRGKDNRSWNQGISSKAVKIEDASEKAMCAIDDSEVSNDKSCSKSCLKNYEALKKQYDDLLVKLNDTGFKSSTYKRGLSILEEQILKYKEYEVLFSEEIVLLRRSVGHKEYQMGLLRTELEKVKEEKEGFEFKISKFEKSAKDLDQLLARQITDKSKKGFGYNVVPSPHPLILNRPKPLDLSYSGLEEFKEPEVNEYGPRNSSLKPTIGCDKESKNSKENTDDSLEQHQKTDTETSSVKSSLKVDKDWKEKIFHPANHVREIEPKKVSVNNDAPIIEDWVSDDEDEVEPIPKVEKKTVIPTATKKEFVKPEKQVTRSVRYAEMYRSQRPRGNQRNWNDQKSNQLGCNFVFNNKACFNCGDFDHIQYSCPKHMAPRAVLMKIGLKTVNNARPVNTVRSVHTSRPFSTARSFNTVRPSYTTHPKSTSNCARPNTYFQNQAQSIVHRPFYKRTTLRKRSYKQNVNTVRAREFNVVKASVCWVWRPIKPNGASLVFNK
ncbi:retrovirus-related pol polyprotein from transposon TNT 1-94 [Tanacetum coccineum]